MGADIKDRGPGKNIFNAQLQREDAEQRWRVDLFLNFIEHPKSPILTLNLLVSYLHSKHSSLASII
jgi:hypothetical protein